MSLKSAKSSKKKNSKSQTQPTRDYSDLEEIMIAQSGNSFRYFGENFEDKPTAIKNKRVENDIITKIVNSNMPLTEDFKKIVENSSNRKTLPLDKEIVEKAKKAPNYTFYNSTKYESIPANEGIWKIINKNKIPNIKDTKKEQKKKEPKKESKEPEKKKSTQETYDDLEREKLLKEREAILLESIDDEEEYVDYSSGLRTEDSTKKEIEEITEKMKEMPKPINDQRILGSINNPDMTYEKLSEIFTKNGLDINEYESFINETRSRGTRKGKPLPPLEKKKEIRSPMIPMSAIPTGIPSPTTSTTTPAPTIPAPTVSALTPEQQALVDLEKLKEETNPSFSSGRSEQGQVINEDISQDINPFIAGEYYPDEFEPKYHLVSILILFGSFNPDWDTRMMENIRSLRISKDEINQRMDWLIEAKGREMQIMKRKTNGELPEYNEICQCWAVITRGLHSGDRTKQALVSLGQLTSFSNLLNSTTETTETKQTTVENTPEDQKIISEIDRGTGITDTAPQTTKSEVRTYTDGQMKPNRPITGPIAEAQKVRTYKTAKVYPDIGKTIPQINKELAEKEKTRYHDSLTIIDTSVKAPNTLTGSVLSNKHQKKKYF